MIAKLGHLAKSEVCAGVRGAIFGKYPIYLFSLTFSLRPDEVATVWCL